MTNGTNRQAMSIVNESRELTVMPKIKGLRWWIIGLIMLGSCINYLTRSTLAVAAPTILQDLKITEKQYSWIVGAFQGAIMLQPICGYIMDVIGLRLGFALFAVAWSLVSMAHSLAHSWQAFAWLRGLLGFNEGSANPAGMKATAEWFPAKERGIAGGIYNIGASVRVHGCSAAGGLGDSALQLAGIVRDYRRPGPDLGCALAVVLSFTGKTPGPHG